MEKLADEQVGKVRVGKLDTDESPVVSSKFGVRSIPTVVVFKDGKEAGRHIGVASKETLLKLLAI